jgi:hypothetical protein
LAGDNGRGISSDGLCVSSQYGFSNRGTQTGSAQEIAVKIKIDQREVEMISWWISGNDSVGWQFLRMWVDLEPLTKSAARKPMSFSRGMNGVIIFEKPLAFCVGL